MITFFTDQQINLVNVKAVGIDKISKKVTTADGMSYPYDKLVLATGASPVIFPIDGIDLSGVFTLRTSGDAVNILNWINSRRVKNAVLIGAGAIGLEIAYLTAQHGLKVTLVEKMEIGGLLYSLLLTLLFLPAAYSLAQGRFGTNKIMPV